MKRFLCLLLFRGLDSALVNNRHFETLETTRLRLQPEHSCFLGIEVGIFIFLIDLDF